MSEEIKEKLDLFPNNMNDIAKEAYYQLENYITSLQQKVEQLEKENKELKQPQVFIDCENMEERYGRDLYEDYLKEKIEQLENIRKEAIEYVKEHARIDDEYPAYIEMLLEEKQDLLNILNKGE